jgi:3-oxoacyl-[acyl-carrier protein] reductase
LRNVVVTGGTRGLGLAIAQELAAGGFCAIAVARQESDAFAASARTAREHGAMRFHAFDLNDLAGLPRLVASLTAQFGPLYGLVNNAGLGTSGVLATLGDAAIERLLRLNVTSPITLSKYAVRSMMVRGDGGRIVNISSIVAATGYSGLSVYAASKAALTGFTRSLAREVGPLGITVNCVAPGFVETDMTQGMKPGQHDQIVRRSALKRLAQAGDVAGAVGYLMSERAANVTGTTLTVDAGNTA